MEVEVKVKVTVKAKAQAGLNHTAKEVTVGKGSL